ncbi:VapE domain-containing protein [Ciceribacter selenitireducens]
MDLTRKYTLDDFPEGDKPGPAGPKGAIAPSALVVPLAIEDVPASLPAFARLLIELGDDPERPLSSQNPRYPSRSEALYSSGCAMARAGYTEYQIAGVLVNRKYGIARSVLEKAQPQQYALRQARKAIAAVSNGWPDIDRSGQPKSTMRNALLGLKRLSLSFSHNQFTHRKIVNGAPLEEHQGEVSDDAVAMLRALIIEAHNFDPKADNVRDAVTQLCLENSFHPIRQMLDALVWDGTPRLDRWMVSYLGAEDTPLNEAVGRITLIAAVRRVRRSNVKFDTIPVLEGPQGTGKSSALRFLAGPCYHSDNEILTLDTKSQMEAMEGVWIYELGELSGLNKADVERVKAFASRELDRARMAYAHHSVARSRQTVFIGTTNEGKYLKDRTGNRRFLPVRTGHIDIDALSRDRDQLWAEASVREAQDKSIVLPRELWAAAAVEQEDRLEDDPWLEKLANVNGKAFGDEARVYTANLLERVLDVPIERQHQGHGKRVAGLLRSLGWEPSKFKVGAKTLRGFKRSKPEGHVDDAPDPPDKI